MTKGIEGFPEDSDGDREWEEEGEDDGGGWDDITGGGDHGDREGEFWDGDDEDNEDEETGDRSSDPTETPSSPEKEYSLYYDILISYAYQEGVELNDDDPERLPFDIKEVEWERLGHYWERQFRKQKRAERKYNITRLNLQELDRYIADLLNNPQDVRTRTAFLKKLKNACEKEMKELEESGCDVGRDIKEVDEKLEYVNHYLQVLSNLEFSRNSLPRLQYVFDLKKFWDAKLCGLIKQIQWRNKELKILAQEILSRQASDDDLTGSEVVAGERGEYGGEVLEDETIFPGNIYGNTTVSFIENPVTGHIDPDVENLKDLGMDELRQMLKDLEEDVKHMEAQLEEEEMLGRNERCNEIKSLVDMVKKEMIPILKNRLAEITGGSNEVAAPIEPIE